MDTAEATSARFDRPPVRHVMLTVYFEAIDSLQVSHFSALRESWRSTYPVTAELPPMRPHNRGGNEALLLPVDPQAWPFPYLMFSTEDDSETVAIQRDRFSLSWKFSGDETAYPGYDHLSRALERRLVELRDHVRREAKEDIVLSGAECIYTNKIEGYTAAEMMVGLATQWQGKIPETGPEVQASYAGVRFHTCTDEDMEACTVNLSLDVDEDGCFLFLESERDVQAEDVRDDLRLGGLDIAHRQLIRKFVQFTSREMHNSWGRAQ